MPAARPTACRLRPGFAAVAALVGALAALEARAAPAESPAAVEAERAQTEKASGSAALLAVQDLESRLIQLQRQLDALEKQRASTEDLKRRIDELQAQLAALAREQASAAALMEASRSESEAETKAPVGSGPGLVFMSPDQSLLVRPTARLAAGFEGVAIDRAPGQLAAADSAGFALRHAELMMEGYVAWQRFEYRLQLDFAPPVAAALTQPAPAPPGLVRDAFVQWRVRGSVALRLGRFKVPFSLQGQYSDARYEMVDLSAATAEFYLDRDVGVMLVGRPWDGRLAYQIAVTNGTTAAFNDNLDLGYAARVVAAPLGALPAGEGDLHRSARPLFSVGGAATFNLQAALPVRDSDGNGRADNIEAWQAGAELRAVWRGAALQAEYFRRWEFRGSAGPDRRFWGGYVQASTFILPRRLQLAARLGRADRALPNVAEELRPRLGRTVREQSAALTYYVRGHDLKVQVDYSHLRADDAVAAPAVPLTMIVYSPRSHQIRAAVQLAF